MGIFDLSLRHKIPIWGSIIIITSTLALSAALMARAYDDLSNDLLASSENLSRTLAKTLFPALLHDDLWRAFEIINAPLHRGAPDTPLDAESILVLDMELKVFVASDPKHMPVLSDLDDLGSGYVHLAHALRETPLRKTQAFDFSSTQQLYVATPISEGERQVGILVMVHGKHAFWPRFLDIAVRSSAIGALVVALLLPINWYWGRRTAGPLVALANGMGALVHGQPSALDPKLYTYRDELGLLFDAYRDAASALHEKALLEKEVLRSERLAAVGRLAAGIAHEVNNPLGGMLMALDNLKQRGPVDPPVEKTMALLERGLRQVADTVGALLIEARVPNRMLERRDFDDMHTLVEPQCVRRAVSLDWRLAMPETLNLPAGFVRQIAINLLLNAVQATEEGGTIHFTASVSPRGLALVVANDGPPIPDTVREHLFEPFVSGHEDGHGLGLWVTYQIVTQLGGQIGVESVDGEVRFTATLPLPVTS